LVGPGFAQALPQRELILSLESAFFVGLTHNQKEVVMNAIRRRSPINPYTGKRKHYVSIQEYGNFWSEKRIGEFSSAKEADEFISKVAKEQNLTIIPHCGGYEYPKRR